MLDALFADDGQTLVALTSMHDMTRIAEGENIVVDPPHRLVQTMKVHWSDEAEAEPTSRVTWEIEPVGDSCRLVVTHDQLRDEVPPELYGGWPMILSGLKTWIETGTTLTTPGSLMYDDPTIQNNKEMPNDNHH